MSEIIKRSIKWAVLALLACIAVFYIRPAYWEAWKAKNAAILTAAESEGKLQSEVKADFLAKLEQAGVKRISAADITVFRDGRMKWGVSADYAVLTPVVEGVTVRFDFLVASDRSDLWAENKN